MTSAQKGYLNISAAIIMLTAMYFLIDYGFQTFPTVNAPSSMFFGLIAALSFTIPIQLLRRNGIQQAKEVACKYPVLLPAIGAMSSIAALLWQWSFTIADPDVITLIAQSEIIFVFALGVFLLRERTSWRELMTLVITMLGIYFVISAKDFAPPIVIGALLAAAAIFALQSYFIKKFTRGLDGLSFSIVRASMMAVMLGVTFATLGKLQPLPWSAVPIFGAVQLIGFILWRTFYFQAHNYLSISVLNPLLMIVPVAVLFVSWVILNIPVTQEKVIGASLVLGGLYFFTREQLRVNPQESQ